MTKSVRQAMTWEWDPFIQDYECVVTMVMDTGSVRQYRPMHMAREILGLKARIADLEGQKPARYAQDVAEIERLAAELAAVRKKTLSAIRYGDAASKRRDEAQAEVDRLAARVADLIEERDRARSELADWRRMKPQPAIGFRDVDGQYHEFVGPTEIRIVSR